MRNHPARAMYDQLEDLLTSMTMQLRPAIAADAQPGTTVTVSLPIAQAA